MKTHLKMMFFLTVLTEVLMMSGKSVVGTVGGEVNIRCPYPDEHKYTPKYFCRQPCTSSAHVLISSEKIDQYITNRRYSLYDNLNGRFFTVTIKNLRLTDSGVYYCGLNQRFRDTLKNVNLTVQPATPVNRPSHTTANTLITSNTYTTTITSAETVAQSSSIVQTGEPTSVVETFDSVTMVYAGVLGLLVFGVLVAFASFCSKRSDLKSRSLQPPVTENSVQDSQNPYQTADVVYHIYDEMMIDTSGTYSTVQLCDPAPQDDANAQYSLITHHTG